MQRTQLKKLIQHAYRLGATDVAIVPATDIVVDDNLAELCREPGCENYGLSKSCPPYVSWPSAFRKQLEKYDQAIFFKIDVPSVILYSSDRREVFQLLHEVAASIEHIAIKMGFIKAQAFAGGSCKKIFCHDHPECLAISAEGKCRNPRYARPSMSGFGINVAKLIETAGWTGSEDTHDADSATTKMASIFGLILIGF
jgi:predicted metal-binding protein